MVAGVILLFVIVTVIALVSQSGGLFSRVASGEQAVHRGEEPGIRAGIASSDRDVEDAEGHTSRNDNVQSITPDAKPKETRVQVPVRSADPVDAPDAGPDVSDEVAALIAEAQAADSADVALELLTRAIAEAQPSDDSARLYGAIGAIELSRDPPNTDTGLAALRSATDSAQSRAARAEAAVAEASALVVHGEGASGVKRIEALLADESMDSVSAARLSLMHGDLLAEQNDLRAAEAAYETVRRSASPSEGGNEALFRQASLRLTRLYAKTGEKKKEQAVATDLKRAFAQR